MLVNRKPISSPLVVLGAAMFIAFLGLGVGCSEDEIKGDATAQGVEAGLNNVLTETVVPLYSFLGAIPTIVGGAPLRGGVVCPNTDSVCAGGGSVVCTPVGDGVSLSFNFDQCVVLTGDAPFTLDGVLVAVPGDPIQLTFNNLFLNDNYPSITGPGSVSVSTCTYMANVTTPDPAAVIGTLYFPCNPQGDYPTAASNLIVSLDDVVITFGFDGSATAYASATQSGNLIANCTVNLAADPLSSSCSAP